jgi:hypothetical protein
MGSVSKSGNKSGLSYLRGRYLRRLQVLYDNSEETAEFHSALFDARKGWNDEHPHYPISGMTMPPNWALPEYANVWPGSVLLPAGLEHLNQESEADSDEDFADWFVLIDLFRDTFWLPELFANPWHGIRHPLDRLVSAWLLYDPRTINASAVESLVPEFRLKPIGFPYPIYDYVDPKSAFLVECQRNVLMGVIVGFVGEERADEIIGRAFEQAESTVERTFSEYRDEVDGVGFAVLPIVPAMNDQDVINAAPEMASLSQAAFHRLSTDNIVRALKREGVPASEIARLLGIDESTVSRAGR